MHNAIRDVRSTKGAFTPTCSSTHLPGYEDKYYKIRARGVDEIHCLSVNDAFVMRNWYGSFFSFDYSLLFEMRPSFEG